MTSERSGLLDPGVNPPYWNDIKNPIGYGWCDSSKQICVFDHKKACRCANHPTRCGDLRKPRFLHPAEERKFNVQKNMATAKETDSDPDPDAHK
jgi:hypothetical protein